MIVKVKALKKLDFNRVIRYMLKDSSSPSFILRHNLRGNKMTDWIAEFQINETKYRKRKRKNATILTHEIMSIAKADTQHLTIVILKALARQYIYLRGKNSLALAVPHFDKDHTHIHFCFSGIKYKSSESMRMSKEQFKQLKQTIQQYQLDHYPQLTQSIVWHGKGSDPLITDREYRVVQREGESDKQKVRRIVKEAKERTEADDELYTYLAKYDITPYQRGSKVVGVVFNKRKYRWRTLDVKENAVDRINDRIQERNVPHF